MITQNKLLQHSVLTAMTEANELKFNSYEEQEKWEGERAAEIFQELKQKYNVK